MVRISGEMLMLMLMSRQNISQQIFVDWIFLRRIFLGKTYSQFWSFISVRMASNCLMCTLLLITLLSTALAEEGRFIFPIIKYCNYDYIKEQDLSTGWSVSRRIRVDIQVPELIKVSSQFIYLDCFESVKTIHLLDMFLWTIIALCLINKHPFLTGYCR